MDLLPTTPQSKSKKRSLRSNLWRGGGFVAIFYFTMICVNPFLSKQKAVTKDMLGLDFLVFYYGGTCARTGHFENLFDLARTKAFEFATAHANNLTLGPGFGPWWNPPLAAWLFAPLSAYPFFTALDIWWAISIVCLAVSLFLMCQMIPGGWKNQLLVPLLILTTMPCFQAFCHAQNTYFSLLLLTSTVVLWRSGQSLLAGLVCGLLFYKPQLGALIAVALCISQGRRAMLGIALTGCALVWINVLTMPGTLHAMLYLMPANLRWFQEMNRYRWERHCTFKAFWRLAFQGWATGPTATSVKCIWILCETALLVPLGVLAFKTFRQRGNASQRDRLIAATIASMPLVMPFYFDYDLLLLSLSVVVYAADRLRAPAPTSGLGPEDRWIVRAWVVFYLVGQIAKILAWTRINPAVPILAVAAAFLIRRGLRPSAEVRVLAPPANRDDWLPLAA
jgi:hypothetical protein